MLVRCWQQKYMKLYHRGLLNISLSEADFCSSANIVSSFCRELWLPPGTIRLQCIFMNVATSGHNKLWRTLVSKFSLHLTGYIPDQA